MSIALTKLEFLLLVLNVVGIVNIISINMNWLSKLLHTHQWKKIYSHASLSLWDQSGTIECGECCTECNKTRTYVKYYRADGSIEKEIIR